MDISLSHAQFQLTQAHEQCLEVGAIVIAKRIRFAMQLLDMETDQLHDEDISWELTQIVSGVTKEEEGCDNSCPYCCEIIV